jgi:hypothetical protein
MEEAHDPMVTEIIGLLRRKPFEPFLLVTRDGAKFLIADGRKMAVRGDRVLFTDPQKGVCFFRTAQLASIEPVVGAA